MVGPIAATETLRNTSCDHKAQTGLSASEKDGTSVTEITAPPTKQSTSDIKHQLKAILQKHRADAQYHRNQLKFHELESKRYAAALEDLGEASASGHAQSRCEALRDYLIDHPNEVITTKALRADPSKYGIITSARQLQLNWLHGRQNRTARKFFVVQNGIIKLQPGITRSTPSCQSGSHVKSAFPHEDPST